MEETVILLRSDQPGGPVQTDCDAVKVHPIHCCSHIITNVMLSLYTATISGPLCYTFAIDTELLPML